MRFINCRIFTGEQGNVVSNGYIAFRNGRIIGLGDMSGCPSDGDDTVDMSGKSLCPGFIDAHTHLGMWEDALGFEGDDGNEQSDPATPHLRALDAVNSFDRCFEEALAAGVTTVVTGPGSANPISGQAICVKTLPGRIDNNIVKAPVAMKMSLGENPKTVYHDREEAPYTRMATAAIIREQLLLAKRYSQSIEEALSDDSEQPDFDMKLDALLSVIKGELPVHFHAHRRDDIFTAMRIAEEFSLKYVIVHGTEGYLCGDELAAAGVCVLSGPFLCDRSKPELRYLSPAAPGKLAAAGVRTAIVTDHPVVPVQYLPLCASLAVREGMDSQTALSAITSVPAELLGVDNRIGRLAVGLDADMLVFNGEPLDFGAKPEMVFVNGEQVRYNNRIEQ